MNGGKFYGTSSAIGSPTMNIQGGLIVNSGIFRSYSGVASGEGFMTINFTNTNNLNNSSTLKLTTGQDRYHCKWNIIIKSGRIITFGSDIEVGTGNNLSTPYQIFTVEDGGKLDVGAYVIKNGSSTFNPSYEPRFSLASGAGLITANTNGISSTGATGSIQVSGSRSYSTGANYTFNGSLAQITGAGLPATVNQLTVDNNLGVTLSNGLAINGILTFTNGKLFTNSNSLVINNGASISGADNSKYIVGSCSKIGTVDFQFPIGTSTYYAPIGIKDLTALSQFTATYQNSAPTNSSLKSPTLVTVSQCEYWDLTRNSGGNAKVVLSWSESGRSCGVDVSYTKVAHWNGSLWEDVGATNLSGDATFGTVTSTLMTSFSPFTLSYSSVTLPIELIYFDALCENENTILKWKTASEMNANSFIIQQSENLTEWTDVGVVSAHGNSNQLIEYRYSIDNKSNKRIYYRLKMVDNDNSFEFSNIKFSNCQTTQPSFVICPNPSSGLVKIVSTGMSTNYRVRVLNVIGVVVYENREPIIDDFNIDLTNFENGIYFVELKTDGSLLTKKVVKQ